MTDAVSLANPAITAFNADPSLSETTEDASSALTADFETFLKLLTTQMQNQDPQEPIDSTEFISQLASFSAVEQQINTNTKLDELIASMSQDATREMASWIGANVRSSAAADFSGAPVEVHFTLPTDATSAQLVVRNDAGTEINRLTVAPGDTTTTWDGKGADGITAADGRYRFTIEAKNGVDPLDPVTAETFGLVQEVRVTDAGLALVFSSGETLPLSEVKAVR